MALTQIDANRILDNIIDEIKVYYSPEDVFDEDAISKWAEDNGYVKEIK
jgi:hypothetical protein